MGVTNYDNLPQNIVETRLKEARQTLIEQKGSLQVNAGNSIFYYLVDGVGAGEFSELFQKVGSGPVTVLIRFVSTFVETPLADMMVELWLSTDGVNFTPQPNYVGYSDPSYYVYESRGQNATPKTTEWAIRITNVPNGRWIGLKVQLLANEAPA